MPLNPREVREFLSVWRECELENLGMRKAELECDINNALNKYRSHEFNGISRPELEREAKRSLDLVLRNFEKRHKDLVFSKPVVIINFGKLNIDFDVHRSSLSIAIYLKLPKSLQEDLREPGEEVDYLARDLGFSRKLGETDEQLRDRIRQIYTKSINPYDNP